jgi:hypothetical protein
MNSTVIGFAASGWARPRAVAAIGFLAISSCYRLWAADPPAPAAAPDSPEAARSAEVARLKTLLAAQQEQLDRQREEIDKMREALDLDRQMLERLSASAPAAPFGGRTSGGLMAASVPALPPAMPSRPAPPPPPSPQTGEPPAPTYVHIGDAYFTPVGFLDFTTVFRSAASGSGIGTNFGAIPFNNVPTARLTELLPNPQNSRIGMRVDTKVHGAHVIGYWESDFLGNNPGNVEVTSNSNTFRMRLFWVDVQKNRWEILGGQSWSLLTPGRKGISPLPADIFYTQVIDVNYVAGLTWGRVPQFRAVYHSPSGVSAGISLEEPQQYIGGSGGQGSITFPTNSNIATNYANQLNNGNTTLAVPNLMPDVVGKVAWDHKVGKLAQHIEVAGIYRAFKVFNPANNNHFTTSGGGGSLNMNFEVLKDFHLIGNFFAADGGGRWLFGSGPDLVIRGDGSISLIHAYSTVSGLEYNPRPTLQLYGYYGGAYFTRNTIIDLNGKLVGYGYFGAPNTQNRSIQEATGGLIWTFWKNPRWGALQYMTQYAYIVRNPWFVAIGQPKSAHNSTVFVNLRYVLPGEPPVIK